MYNTIHLIKPKLPESESLITLRIDMSVQTITGIINTINTRGASYTPSKVLDVLSVHQIVYLVYPTHTPTHLTEY